MEVTRTARNITNKLRIGDYNFEQVQNFSYLGSQINTINSLTNEKSPYCEWK
jgi:hypothetical protein